MPDILTPTNLTIAESLTTEQAIARVQRLIAELRDSAGNYLSRRLPQLAAPSLSEEPLGNANLAFYSAKNDARRALDVLALEHVLAVIADSATLRAVLEELEVVLDA